MPDVELRLIANNEDYVKGITESQKAYQTFNDAVKEGAIDQQELMAGIVDGIHQEMGMIQKSDKVIAKAGKSLKTELRAIKEELARMEQAGTTASKKFMELSIRAGELEDQIGDTQQQIKILASDTKNLDAAMSVGTGLAGGFALAEGAMAVFGKEGENLQRQLVKLQGGMNILNGLQSVSNTLNKDSAARVVLAAKAQQIYSLAVGTSTGAMKAFRLALLATGIGALIVGLGLLIANWDKVSKAVSNFFSVNAKLSNQIDDQIELNKELVRINEVRAGQIDNQIALLEAQGDMEEQIYKLQKEKAILNLKNKLAEIDVTRKQLQLNQEEINSRVAANAMATAQYGALGNLFTRVFKDAGKSIEKQKEINKQLEDQNIAYDEIATQIRVLDLQELKRVKTAKDKEIEKSLERQREKAKELADLLKQIADKEQDAKLSMLSGADRIQAEGEIQLQEVQMLEDHLKNLGALTQEQYDQLNIIRESIRKGSLAKLKELDQKELNDTKDKNNRLTELQRKIDEDQLELIGAGEKEKLELKKRFLMEDLQQIMFATDEETKLRAAGIRKQIELLDKELSNLSKAPKFNIWRLLGLDPDSEEGQKGIDALKESASIIMDQIGQIMDAELKQAEQHTQVLEDRLSEAESALQEELNLQKEGYANNVDLKKQEIETLKQERDKALEEEKKVKNAQLLLDSAGQISSLVTATANLWATSSKLGPILGPILAGIATAAMWGSFTVAKVKAAQLAKLEKGGHGDSTGIIQGRRHSSGGEMFSDHIEVESGERWGVLNRQASQKFGNLFPYMIDSMNKLQFPNLALKAGSQVVNIDTKRMTSKLESIDSGIRSLNDNMLSRGDAFYSNGKKIIKLNDHHIRIVHATN